jgi:hypothetical protein
MKIQTVIHRQVPVLLIAIFMIIAGAGSSVTAKTVNGIGPNPSANTVKVKLVAGIYRDWDKSWMTTAPDDVVATLTSSAGTQTRKPASYDGLVVFDGVPCGEQVKITLKFVGTADYKSNSQTYTKMIPCGKPVVSLGKLEYGTW